MRYPYKSGPGILLVVNTMDLAHRHAQQAYHKVAVFNSTICK